jgi:hypothetical protein
MFVDNGHQHVSSSAARRGMAEFETVKSQVCDIGTGGFVAVERRRVRDGDKPPNEFLVIARGFYLRDGTARRRNFVTLPDNAEAKAFLAKAIGEV